MASSPDDVTIPPPTMVPFSYNGFIVMGTLIFMIVMFFIVGVFLHCKNGCCGGTCCKKAEERFSVHVEPTDVTRSMTEPVMLSDYTIEVEDTELKVHKDFLASSSDYFRAMFSVGMLESKADRVRLKGQSSIAVSAMIKYIYTGQFGATKASVKELLACAVYLQIPAAIVECTELLYNEVNKENCFDILSTFQLYYIKDGIQQTVRYIKTNFDDIMKQYVPEETSYTTLINLMEVWQKSEWDLYLCVEEWVKVDLENRKHHLEDLLSRVRYALMPLEELQALKRDVYSDASVCDLVDKAIEFHALPVNLKVIDESEQSRTRNALPGFLKPYFSSWKQYTSPSEPEIKFGRLYVNNYLISCVPSNKCSNQMWFISNLPHKSTEMAPMLTPRADFAVVHCETHLYALGGLVGPEESQSTTDEIERYDFKTNTWSVLPDKLPVALYKLSASVIDGCIYVGGGKENSDAEFSTRLDCLNLSTGTWSRKATMEPYDALHMFDVIELSGEKVLFMIGKDIKMQYYSPVADRWVNSDSRPHQMKKLVYGFWF